ncbi:MAG: S41 family peptidase, partial [Gemmatimonadaceae bacterium]|nr:S41 family peptidase [Gemmatimonadaceae bacterium]
TTADGRTIAVDRRRNPAPATTAPTVPHRWLVQDSVAYVRIAGFDPSLYADSAVAAIRGRYMSAAAIVVDVRGNGGGNTPMGLMRLLAAGRHAQGLRLVESKLRRDFGQVGGRLESLGDADGYRGSAIVLADRGCGSACEDFVAPFATASWARVIGDTTYGSTGQPVFETLPTGMRFAVAARRYTLADGRPFEDVGIPPHEVVPVTLEDVRAGRDPMLARALAWAREQVGAGRLR